MTLKLKREAVLFEGGPWDRWALYLDDLQAHIAAETYMGRRFDYRDADRQGVHPRAGGKITSAVWVYAP
jgi:hypothetical protein